MRLSDGTRFPHPVLREGSLDFQLGNFEVRFDVQEKPRIGALQLRHEITLTEPAIKAMVEAGRASVGCFVRCNDTYFAELRELGWPLGLTDFAPGSLVNRVVLRPLIWVKEPVGSWDPGTIHPEFEPPVSLDRGAVIAIGPEYVLSVGQAKFAPLESIFELSAAEEVPADRIRINPDSDRVAILVAPALYETINLLRGQAIGRSLLLNAVYLPAVIELLDILRADAAQYAGKRWHQPFMAKCDSKGIDPSTGVSLFESAQTLLGDPARELARIASESES